MSMQATPEQRIEQLKSELDAARGRITDLEAELAEYRAGATIYVNLAQTGSGPGQPAGTWSADEPEPAKTIHALGDPDDVAAVRAFVATAREARASIEAALALHRPVVVYVPRPVCCEDGAPYPCPTVRALGGSGTVDREPEATT